MHEWALTFDMSGGARGAKRPLARPLDGRVRPHLARTSKVVSSGTSTFRVSSRTVTEMCQIPIGSPGSKPSCSRELQSRTN